VEKEPRAKNQGNFKKQQIKKREAKDFPFLILFILLFFLPILFVLIGLHYLDLGS